MDSDILLSAKGIDLSIGSKSILNNVSIDVKENEIVTIIGPNGAGKTSLIRILLGLLPSEGDINFREGLSIGYVPQCVIINEHLPLRVIDFLCLEKNYAELEINAVMSEVGIQHLINEAIQNISGGEMQRVLLARALLKKPDLLVLDEPAQGVDIIGQQALYKTITDIRDQRRCGVLMVSHDLHLVMASTDKVICINTHICCSGHPDHVSEHPEYLKLFGSALDGLAVYSHHHDHEHDIHGNIVSDSKHDHSSSEDGHA